MKFLLALSVSFLVSGCASLVPGMPGATEVDISKHDGTVSIVSHPGYADPGLLLIGARKTSNMENDKALLIVKRNDVRYFDRNHPNLFIKVDGIEHELSPTSNHTECNVDRGIAANCSQEYLVDLAFIRSVVAAGDVTVKLSLRDGLYTEEALKRDYMQTAKYALKHFIKQVDKHFVSKSMQKADASGISSQR